LESTKLDLARVLQQNIALTASEKDARLWNERLQKEQNDLRSNNEDLQRRNKSLELSGLDATEKMRLLEIGESLIYSVGQNRFRARSLLVITDLTPQINTGWMKTISDSKGILLSVLS